jgi:hypothetical protein
MVGLTATVSTLVTASKRGIIVLHNRVENCYQLTHERNRRGPRRRMVGLTATVSTLVTATARKRYITMLWECCNMAQIIDRMVGLTATVSTLVTATASKCYVTVLWGCCNMAQEKGSRGPRRRMVGLTAPVSTLVTAFYDVSRRC